MENESENEPAMHRLDRGITNWAQRAGGLSGLTLAELGDMQRALRAALVEVEEAMGPKIVARSEDGLTYVELCSESGYRSVTTITRIMREMGASPGRGTNHPVARGRAAA